MPITRKMCLNPPWHHSIRSILSETITCSTMIRWGYGRLWEPIIRLNYVIGSIFTYYREIWYFYSRTSIFTFRQFNKHITCIIHLSFNTQKWRTIQCNPLHWTQKLTHELNNSLGTTGWLVQTCYISSRTNSPESVEELSINTGSVTCGVESWSFICFCKSLILVVATFATRTATQRSWIERDKINVRNLQREREGE